MDETNFFTEEQIAFYKEALELLNRNEMPWLIGGAFAIREYTGISRNTKDIDIFCKAADYQKVLKLFVDKGLKVEVTDARWLAKVFKDGYFIDIIFSTSNNLCPVDDSWFTNAIEGTLFGVSVKVMTPEDLIWCKTYIQDRGRFDGADINHLLLRQAKNLDWNRLLHRLDHHWHLLFSQLLTFQFVYPSDRDVIPRWLFDELLKRAGDQFDLPPSENKVCLGPIIDHKSYEIDIKEWNYKVVTLNSV